MIERNAKAAVVRYWWDKAQDSLDSARRELAAGAFAFAVNRAYYALFYAVSALLLEEGLQFKKHSGVRAAFNRDFIATGRVERKYGELYTQLFDDRQTGDYIALTTFNAQYVQEKIEACQECLAHLRPLYKLLPPDVIEE